MNLDCEVSFGHGDLLIFQITDINKSESEFIKMNSNWDFICLFFLLLTQLFVNISMYANCILASSMDKEMIDILANLAEEASPQDSQKATLSQSISLDQGRMAEDEKKVTLGPRRPTRPEFIPVSVA